MSVDPISQARERLQTLDIKVEEERLVGHTERVAQLDPKKLRAEYVAADAKVKRLQSEVKEAQFDAAILEARMLQEFQSEGVNKLTRGRNTISLRSEKWVFAKPGTDRSLICKALKRIRLGHIVAPSYGVRTLSAIAKDRETARLPPLPPSLAKLCNYVTRWRVVVSNNKPPVKKGKR